MKVEDFVKTLNEAGIEIKESDVVYMCDECVDSYKMELNFEGDHLCASCGRHRVEDIIEKMKDAEGDVIEVRPITIGKEK